MVRAGSHRFWLRVGSHLVTVQRQTVCRKIRLLVISTMGVAVSWHSSCWVLLAKNCTLCFLGLALELQGEGLATARAVAKEPVLGATFPRLQLGG